jgi:hypothetical protein
MQIATPIDYPSLADRFWRHVVRRGADECWPWNGSTLKGGRGTLSAGRRTITASRIAYSLHAGKAPGDGLFICHTCDNQNCVNPAHLYEGTHKDNVRDRTVRDRQPRAEQHPFAKLTEKDVAEIRASPLSELQIADKFGTDPSNVHRIRSGKYWSRSYQPIPDHSKVTPGAVEIRYVNGEIDEVCAPGFHMERLNHNHVFFSIGDMKVWLYSGRCKLTLSGEVSDATSCLAALQGDYPVCVCGRAYRAHETGDSK